MDQKPNVRAEGDPLDHREIKSVPASGDPTFAFDYQRRGGVPASRAWSGGKFIPIYSENPGHKGVSGSRQLHFPVSKVWAS